MGARQAKHARSVPVRYVAKYIPRDPKAVEEEFVKAKHTVEGINSAREQMTNVPRPYSEKTFTPESTVVPDHAAPKPYLNTYLEMADNMREERSVIIGSLPLHWFRDHHEPYSLVRNRIDDEDLTWLLSEETRKKSLDEIVPQTKLERDVVEDLLATVELPRRQFRNYQGKLVKAVEEGNKFIEDRKKQIQEAREDELLRSIGYTDKEIADDQQYRTERSRGVKALDELNVSLRQRMRHEKYIQLSDMEDMLERRRIDQIASGEYEPQKEELKTEHVNVKTVRRVRASDKSVLSKDMGFNPRFLSQRKWWLERRRAVQYGKDIIYDVPEYNSTLGSTEEKAKSDMERGMHIGQAMNPSSATAGTDPRDQYTTLLDALRKHAKEPEDSHIKIMHSPGTKAVDAATYGLSKKPTEANEATTQDETTAQESKDAKQQTEEAAKMTDADLGADRARIRDLNMRMVSAAGKKGGAPQAKASEEIKSTMKNMAEGLPGVPDVGLPLSVQIKSARELEIEAYEKAYYASYHADAYNKDSSQDRRFEDPNLDPRERRRRKFEKEQRQAQKSSAGSATSQRTSTSEQHGPTAPQGESETVASQVPPPSPVPTPPPPSSSPQ